MITPFFFYLPLFPFPFTSATTVTPPMELPRSKEARDTPQVLTTSRSQPHPPLFVRVRFSCPDLFSHISSGVCHRCALALYSSLHAHVKIKDFNNNNNLRRLWLPASLSARCCIFLLE